MITETSKEAYQGILPEIGIKQKLVLDCFKTLNMANNKMVSMYLKLPINSVTGRTNELRDMKLLTFSHEAPCPWTNKNTQYWKVTKWGEKLADLIIDPKLSRLNYRPYLVENLYDTTIFKACSRDIDSKDWHNVEIVSPGIGEIRSICDCYDFDVTKQKMEDCKHLIDLKMKLIKDGEL